MAEREQVIIARAIKDSADIRFEVIKKVLPMKPKSVLMSLEKDYPTIARVANLFEVEEKENTEEITGKAALIENAELFKIRSIYIFGFQKQNEWLHLDALGDKKLREARSFAE